MSMTLGVLFRAALVAAFVLSGSIPAQAQESSALDRCVPPDLRGDLISFRAEDDVEIRGLVLGGGSRGVLLAGSQTEFDPCGWLPFARELADDGYQVLVSDIRGPVRDDRLKNFRWDLDVEAGARELDRRGAGSIVAVGSSTGASVVAASARKIPGLAGLVLLSPLKAVKAGQAGRLDAVGVLETAGVRVFIAAAEDDRAVNDEGDGFVAADHARELAEAASGSRLALVPGEAHGTELIKDDGRLRGEMRAFVEEVLPVPSYERWLKPVAVGVVVLGLLAVVLIVWRRRVRKSGSQDDRAGAVGGDETR